MTRGHWIGVMFLTIGLVLYPVLIWAQQGTAAHGEALFIGSVKFAEGGAPCLACHGIAGHQLGYAAGASYGPDLTMLYEDYGKEGVAAVLESPSAFESMAAIYADRPLTEDEIADLTAFFATVADQEAANIGTGLVVHALLGTILLMIVFAAFGWQRFKAVRRPLVDQARFGKGGAA